MTCRGVPTRPWSMDRGRHRAFGKQRGERLSPWARVRALRDLGPLPPWRQPPETGTWDPPRVRPRRRCLMRVPAWIKPMLWGGVLGAIGIMIVGFAWLGWTLDHTSKRLVAEGSEAAV